MSLSTTALAMANSVAIRAGILLYFSRETMCGNTLSCLIHNFPRSRSATGNRVMSLARICKTLIVGPTAKWWVARDGRE